MLQVVRFDSSTNRQCWKGKADIPFWRDPSCQPQRRLGNFWFFVTVILYLVSFVSPYRGVGQVDRLPREPVWDEVGVISQTWKRQVDEKLMSLYQKTQVQIQIYIARDTAGLSLEEFSLKVAERMGLGRAETDRGLLILLVPSQRQARLEVGYGLEGVIPDVVAKRLLEEVLFPYLRMGDFEAGLETLLWRIFQKIQSDPEFDSPKSLLRGEGSIWIELLVFFTFLLVLLVMPWFGVVTRGSSRFPGGFGGGWGGWGGGGGGFGGGGASGRW